MEMLHGRAVYQQGLQIHGVNVRNTSDKIMNIWLYKYKSNRLAAVIDNILNSMCVFARDLL